jgi:IclR family pca regulon transcriptional regulator
LDVGRTTELQVETRPAGTAGIKSAEISAEEAPESGPDFVESLARGLAVILAFADMARPPTISDLSRATGLSRAAVRRILLTLERLGYVVGDGRAFRLQPKTLTLCHAYIASNPLTARAQEVLDRIAAEVRESCSIGVLDEGAITFVARSFGHRLVSANLTIGARLPAFCTSLGRVILANMPADEVDQYFKATPLERFTSATEVDEQNLRAILQEVRKLGYSIMRTQFEEGLTTIAVPIFDTSGRIRAGIGIAAIAHTPDSLREKALPLILEAARELSMRLSF